ncbi:MAG TPA: hypothetical protein VN648_03200 [Candidatus Methylomirabilis sp.]|nr:hypothetical protein [Candidatus Methylomirabilis sp.]
MAVTEIITAFKQGQQDVFQVSVPGVLWHKWSLDGGNTWTNEAIAGPAGGVSGKALTLTVAEPKVSIVDGECVVTVEDATTHVWNFKQSVTGAAWTPQALP